MIIKKPSYQRSLYVLLLTGCVLLLIGSAYTAWQREVAQRRYDALALQRADQTLENNLYSKEVTPNVIAGSELRTSFGTSTTPVPARPVTDNSTWLSINADYAGWIKIPGTKIDYPYVRSKDNKDYLKRDFYGKSSEAGTLFLDYRNLGNFNDPHALIYGHNMKNKTMFHNLTLYKDPAFLADHDLIEWSGLYETRTYKIFSVYEISADDYAFTLQFDSETAYSAYLNALAAQSLHPSAPISDPGQRLLTLVTCSYGTNNGRMVVHALEL